MKTKILVVSLILMLTQIIGGTDKKETDSVDEYEAKPPSVEEYEGRSPLDIFAAIVELNPEYVPSTTSEILQGLTGVSVNVGFEPKTKIHSLTNQLIRTDTELQLRQYGIKVLTPEERIKAVGWPSLNITVVVLIRKDFPDGLASVMIKVELAETVLLLREPARFCLYAVTWKESTLLSVGTDRLREVRGSIKDLVGNFCNDYLTANPKESEVLK